MIVAGVVVFVLVASQVLIPTLGERRVEDRLTEGGGSAEVTREPSRRSGCCSPMASASRSTRDLDLDLDEEVEVFDRLDGFSIVDVSIEDSVAGRSSSRASASLATARVPTASSPTARRPPAGSPRRASRPWSCPENRSPT